MMIMQPRNCLILANFKILKCFYIYFKQKSECTTVPTVCVCVCVCTVGRNEQKKSTTGVHWTSGHIWARARKCANHHHSVRLGSSTMKGGGDRNGIVHDRDRLCFNIINNNNNKKKSHSNWTPFLQETPLAPGRGHFIILILYNFETCAPWAFTHSIPLTIVPSSFDCLIIDESPTIDVCVCVCVCGYASDVA